MQEVNAQMALRLHQITGEPLAHCSYLLDQTKGDYETALKILERILQQRNADSKALSAGGENPSMSDAAVSTSLQTDSPGDAGIPMASMPPVASLEERVQRLENQLAYLGETLDTVGQKLTLLLQKLSSTDPE